MINVVINILNLNDNSPIFSSPLFRFEVMENVPAGTFIGQITAADDDDDLFGVIEYSLSEDMFAIDKQTGEIYSNGEIDREVRPVFNFQGLATDGGWFISNFFIENFGKNLEIHIFGDFIRIILLFREQDSISTNYCHCKR